MKLVLHLIALCLSAVVVALPVRADPSGDFDFLQDHPVGGDPVGPDPDATPKAFEPKPVEMSPAVRAVLIENLKKTQANREWLVRGYEQQVQARSSKSAESSNYNLYSELSGNKDLAKIAGIDNAEFTTPPELIDFHTDGHSDQTDASLRPDPGVQTSASPELAPRKSLYFSSSYLDEFKAGAPYAAPSPIASTDLAPLSITPAENREDVPATSRYRPTDPGAMDIPGMTAAEANPASANLSSEDLPGGNTRFSSTATSDLSLDPTVTTNAERLDKVRQTQLLAPGQVAKKPTPVVSQVKVPAPSDTEQMVPDPGSQRVHLDDPFDILR